jgi:hypothetical protein
MRHDCGGTSELEVPVLETPRRFFGPSHEGVNVLFLVISHTLGPEVVAERGIKKVYKQASLTLVAGECPLISVESLHTSNLDDPL